MITSPSLPAIHTLDLLELVSRWHVLPEDLLHGLGLTPTDLAAPRAQLPLTTAAILIERARALTGEPALGFYLGLKMRVSNHGFLGLAAMMADTVGDALALATRFAPTRTTALSLSLSTEDGLASLAVHEHAEFGTVRDVILFTLLVGIARIGAELTGTALGGAAELPFSEPPYFRRVRHLAPGRVRFDQPTARLVFDADALNLPLTMADPAALALAREQCERELEALGFSERLSPRVTAALADRDGRTRPLEAVARALGMSSRTLKRRLGDEQTSFSALRDAWLRDRATLLLRQADATVEGVAARLGYSDAANFSRAFTRWTGLSPGAFRRRG